MKESEIIFGNKPVLEALEANKEIDKIFIKQGIHPMKIQNIKKLAIAQKVPFQFVPKVKLDKITRKNHQGIIALIPQVSYAQIENIIQHVFEQGRQPFILILDKVSDVRNFGSIARTAECAGVDAILIPSSGAAQINGVAIKSSAGALNNIPVCRVSSLQATV